MAFATTTTLLAPATASIFVTSAAAAFPYPVKTSPLKTHTSSCLIALSARSPGDVVASSSDKSPTERKPGLLLDGNTFIEIEASFFPLIWGSSSLLQATMPKAIIATNNNLNSFILFKI